jgi:hypothetical protein
MKHFVPHDVSPELAHRALDQAFASYSTKYAKYQPQMHWSSERRAEIGFNAKGVAISGTADVDDKGITFDLKVPFVLSVFKSKAVQYLEQESQKWIARAKAGTA